jgi:hypothetical protein
MVGLNAAGRCSTSRTKYFSVGGPGASPKLLSGISSPSIMGAFVAVVGTVVADEAVESYLAQLQMILPYVQPNSVDRLKALHRARDYEGMVRFIRKAMNIDIKLIIGWVNAGGHNPSSPAWVELPAKVADMPYHGTEAFKSTTLRMFFRKSFLEAADYDEISMAIAHELSHVILASLRSPLWEVEKGVDLPSSRSTPVGCFLMRLGAIQISRPTSRRSSPSSIKAAISRLTFCR